MNPKDRPSEETEPTTEKPEPDPTVRDDFGDAPDLEESVERNSEKDDVGVDVI